MFGEANGQQKVCCIKTVNIGNEIRVILLNYNALQNDRPAF